MKHSLLLPALLLSLLSPAPAAAPQSGAPLEFPALSPVGSVKQRFGLTDVEIGYSRPSCRGRAIFGELVPFGSVWRCGANAATRVSFSTPVEFGGVKVPAGSYALFAVPDVDEWTLILNSVAEQWGSYAHDATKDVAKVQVKPTTPAEPVETLEIGLCDLGLDSATLYLAWERMRVGVRLKADVAAMLVPRIQAAMAGEGKKPYLQAAMFYYDNGLDLKQALAWIDAAVAEQPEAFWIVHRKGLIQAKMGDKPGAIESATKSLELAKKAQGAIRDEYVALNEALLARLR